MIYASAISYSQSLIFTDLDLSFAYKVEQDNFYVQKAQLDNSELLIWATVYDQQQDVQYAVTFAYENKTWKIKKIKQKYTAFAGFDLLNNHVLAVTVAGKNWNILNHNIADLQNERDFIQLSTDKFLFTSDKSGFFQIYQSNNGKTEHLNLQNNDNHIINLWMNKGSTEIYLDMVDPEDDNSNIYTYQNNKTTLWSSKYSSVSFNDSIIVFIDKGKLKVFKIILKSKPVYQKFIVEEGADRVYRLSEKISKVETEGNNRLISNPNDVLSDVKKHCRKIGNTSKEMTELIQELERITKLKEEQNNENEVNKEASQYVNIKYIVLGYYTKNIRTSEAFSQLTGIKNIERIKYKSGYRYYVNMNTHISIFDLKMVLSEYRNLMSPFGDYPFAVDYQGNEIDY